MPDRYDNYTRLKDWKDDSFGHFTSAEERFYRAEIGVARKSDESLLEIGFGNGSLLGWAATSGYTVSGYEVQDILRKRASAAGFHVLDDLQSVKRESFSVIAAFDVFEHIETADLEHLLKSLYAALKPGGKLVARFPNGDSPFSMPTFNGDLTHLTWLGRGKVEMLMLSSGFLQYYLRAPREAFGLIGYIKYAPKAALRAAHRLFVKAAYLGGTAPITFHLNYLLVAFKRKPTI